MTNEEIRSLCAETLGAIDYNQLIDSYEQTLRHGKLRFWQEQLFAKVNPLLDKPIEDIQTFEEVFEHASLLDLYHQEWTKERFLCEITMNPLGGIHFGMIPYDWFGAAWQIESVRGTITGYQIREIGKNGWLGQSAEYLNYLNNALTTEQLVEYYIDLARGCPERESEMREEFEAVFPKCVHALPPVGHVAPPRQFDPNQVVMGSDDDIPF